MDECIWWMRIRREAKIEIVEEKNQQLIDIFVWNQNPFSGLSEVQIQQWKVQSTIERKKKLSKMLTSANNASNQYIRPDYLSPLPTTVGFNNNCKSIFSKRFCPVRFAFTIICVKVCSVRVHIVVTTNRRARARPRSPRRGLGATHTYGKTTKQI